MPETFAASLPAELRSLSARPLFAIRLDARAPMPLIPVPGAGRRIGVVTGGSFEGERLSGTVMDGGSDWQTLRADGKVELDVRIVLRTTDDAVIAMTYRGIRHAAPDVLARVDRGEVVAPSEVYFRTAVFFETAAPRYDWLNHAIAVGIGHRRADGPVYNVFEIL